MMEKKEEKKKKKGRSRERGALRENCGRGDLMIPGNDYGPVGASGGRMGHGVLQIQGHGWCRVLGLARCGIAAHG